MLQFHKTFYLLFIAGLYFFDVEHDILPRISKFVFSIFYALWGKLTDIRANPLSLIVS
jgi:hypothetical protein